MPWKKVWSGAKKLNKKRIQAEVKLGQKAGRGVYKAATRKYSAGHVAGAAAGVGAAGEFRRRRTKKKSLARGRRQGLIVGAHLNKKARKKVRSTYRKARKAGHRF